MAKNADKTLAGFEAGMQELEQTLQALSADEVSLERSIALYARAAELIKQSDGILKDAQLRIDEIDASIKDLEPED